MVGSGALVDDLRRTPHTNQWRLCSVLLCFTRRPITSLQRGCWPSIVVAVTMFKFPLIQPSVLTLLCYPELTVELEYI